ncbi:Bcr/CflA family efflux MFS transporter [Paenibacillus pinisoli]|uniref:Bcr/CflA family efflux transporter n=1 Tax=Paenibacillus pinisoli TaxID=1276110 RepID=A0A3A6PNJ6_9BACL|nr:multidrug effflux MFS transporter [Paenibacillus pinisoli]RJX37543.1 Bcr/CflA family efflux MFS transporter [Paenibacillus pinisoli]
MKKRAVPSLLLMIVLVAFPQISETIYTPSLPDISAAFGVANTLVQMTLSIYFIGFALGVFCWGWISDLIGRRPAMLAGLICYGIGSLMCLLSPTMEWLLVSRLVQAFGAATGSIITQTILRESLSGNERNTVFAQISAVIAFTPAAGPLIGGWVDQIWGFEAIFFVLVALSAGLFAYAYTSLPETHPPEARVRAAVWPVCKRMLAKPRVISFALLIGGINGILFSYYAEAPFIFIGYFGLSPGLYGFLGIMVALASAAGAMWSKGLLARYRPETIIHLGLGVMTVGALLLVIANAVVTVDDLLFWSMILSLFIMLLGAGMALPNCLSLALVDFRDVAGTAGAVFSSGYYVLVSLITMGMGLLHNGALMTMPIYFMALSIGMALIGLIWIREKA